MGAVYRVVTALALVYQVLQRLKKEAFKRYFMHMLKKTLLTACELVKYIKCYRKNFNMILNQQLFYRKKSQKCLNQYFFFVSLLVEVIDLCK